MKTLISLSITLLLALAVSTEVEAQTQPDTELNFINIEVMDSIHVDTVVTNNPQLHFHKSFTFDGKKYPTQDRIYLTDSASVRSYCEPYRESILLTIRYLEGILTEQQ